jgi:hypothetical protein
VSFVALMFQRPLSLIYHGHHQALDPAAPTDHPFFNTALAQASQIQSMYRPFLLPQQRMSRPTRRRCKLGVVAVLYVQLCGLVVEAQHDFDLRFGLWSQTLKTCKNVDFREIGGLIRRDKEEVYY